LQILLSGLSADRKPTFPQVQHRYELAAPAADAGSVLDEAGALPCVEILLATHFSDAEGVDGIAAQMRVRMSPPRPRAPWPPGGSAAFSKRRGDWVRPGLMLYGASPLQQRA
jgi:hypothetical protein